MHDFHLADQIVKIAKEYAEKNGLQKISEISIELGDIIEHGDNIKPTNLKFNINLLMPEVRVKIKKIKSNIWKLCTIS